MASWWPFGRKRRKVPSLEASQTQQYSISQGQSLKSEPEFVPGQPFVVTSRPSPLSLPLQLNEKSSATAPRSQPQTPSRPLQQRMSFDQSLSSPLRQGIDRSPHLRPVPSSELNLSPSLRSLKSPNDSGNFRRLSRRSRDDDRILKEKLESPTDCISPVARPARISEERGSLSRAGSKRKRITATGDPFVRNSVSSAPDTALPQPEPQMTQVADGALFNVGSIFSPHPTIHYSSQIERPSTSARTLLGSSAGPLTRQVLQESKTVDDLANDLDANQLRKAMERDQRRRERRRRTQEERARQKLNQYTSRAEGSELSLQGPTTVKQTRAPEAGPSRLGGRTVTANWQQRQEHDLLIRNTPRENPFADPVHPPAVVNASIPIPIKQIKSPFDIPVPRIPQIVGYGQMSLSPPASPRQHARARSSLSNMLDSRNPSLDLLAVGDSAKRASGASSRAGSRAGSLAALFRKGMPGLATGEEKSKLVPSEPSFSNVSRNSMPRQLQPPPVLRDERPASPKNAAYRSKSIFVEDLPEFPLSPPDSRIQSPSVPDLGEPRSAPIQIGAERSSSTPAGRDRLHVDPLEPTVAGATTLLSRSLASVDSEASWLSGRLSSRAPPTPKRLATSLSVEGLSVSEAGMYSRIPIPEKNPARTRPGGIRTALAAEGTGLGIIPSPIEESVTHGEVSRNNAEMHEGSRVKSAEGLLKQWSNDESNATAGERTDLGTPEPDSPTGRPETPWLENAHARHLSSGSVRLLDIPARHGSQRSSMHIGPEPI